MDMVRRVYQQTVCTTHNTNFEWIANHRSFVGLISLFICTPSTITVVVSQLPLRFGLTLTSHHHHRRESKLTCLPERQKCELRVTTTCNENVNTQFCIRNGVINVLQRSYLMITTDELQHLYRTFYTVYNSYCYYLLLILL